MDYAHHFERSWKLFTRYLPPILLSTLVLIGVSCISFGIMAPVMTAGFMQSMLDALRTDRKPEIRDLFSRMDLFFPLLGFSILCFLLVFFGLVMLIVPGLVVILALMYCCLYLTLLMTDRDLALFAAIRESTRMAMQEPYSEHLVVVAVYFVLTSIGSSTGIGMLFTLPYASLFVASIYMDKVIRLLPAPDQQGTPPPPPGS